MTCTHYNKFITLYRFQGQVDDYLVYQIKYSKQHFTGYKARLMTVANTQAAVSTYVHTIILTHMRAHMHTHTHAPTPTHMHMHACKHMHTNTNQESTSLLWTTLAHT